MSKYYNNNDNRDQQSSDGLPIIQNSASLLYMRKNNNNSKVRGCPLVNTPAENIDYKNVQLIEKFITERGKIMPSRITAVSFKKQRILKQAIKVARTLALLPYEN